MCTVLYCELPWFCTCCSGSRAASTTASLPITMTAAAATSPAAACEACPRQCPAASWQAPTGGTGLQRGFDRAPSEWLQCVRSEPELSYTRQACRSTRSAVQGVQNCLESCRCVAQQQLTIVRLACHCHKQQLSLYRHVVIQCCKMRNWCSLLK